MSSIAMDINLDEISIIDEQRYSGKRNIFARDPAYYCGSKRSLGYKMSRLGSWRHVESRYDEIESLASKYNKERFDMLNAMSSRRPDAEYVFIQFTDDQSLTCIKYYVKQKSFSTASTDEVVEMCFKNKQMKFVTATLEERQTFTRLTERNRTLSTRAHVFYSLFKLDVEARLEKFLKTSGKHSNDGQSWQKEDAIFVIKNEHRNYIIHCDQGYTPFKWMNYSNLYVAK